MYLHGHGPLEGHKIQSNELARALTVVRASTSDFPSSFFSNILLEWQVWLSNNQRNFCAQDMGPYTHGDKPILFNSSLTAVVSVGYSTSLCLSFLACKNQNDNTTCDYIYIVHFQGRRICNLGPNPLLEIILLSLDALCSCGINSPLRELPTHACLVTKLTRLTGPSS